MTREDTISKVRKLLSLADPKNGATENEIAVAMMRAKELTARHDLEMAEVFLKKDYPGIRIVTEHALHRSGKKTIRTWERWLGSAVGTICGTQIYTQPMPSGYSSTGKQKWDARLYFAGMEKDVAISVEFFKGLHRYALGRAKAVLGGSYSPPHRNFCEGFSRVVWERVQKKVPMKKEEEQTYALVVQKKDIAIQLHFASMGIMTRRKRKRSATFDSNAYSAGGREGCKVDLGTERRLK